ncbi:YtxH domain-containing protein [Mucilaginibacter ginkgonis]|uniref:YtxH domain-containing protein n=1 Tax=Mucilaginibacter ginkgonis TaxID=2682091 RepID=A0A6I4I0C9_9SPHI|nr:YtxH domain-containing protein [Mucilaginibacter ginkgonis]QQL49808.1 YtxH domain-containing protein [Mucilaginibacter ginkgonis]
MSILKYALVGAAVAWGINHITQKRDTDGKSILDDIQDKAPEWMDKVKAYADDTLSQVNQRAQQAREDYQG